MDKEPSSIPLKERLAEHMQLDAQVRLLNSDESIFHEAMEIALSNQHPYAWRAAWIIHHSIEKNDLRILPYTERIIRCLEHEPDGYQRELLNILLKIRIENEMEGLLFDRCLDIWVKTKKIPSVRITALKFIFRIVKKYPDLRHEVDLVLTKEYIESLSPGIRNTVFRMMEEL